jgi:hypothetical protein
LLQVKFQRVTEAYKALTTPGYDHEHDSDDEHSGDEEDEDFDEFMSHEALFELFNMMFGDSGLDDSEYDDEEGFGDPMDIGELLAHMMPGLGGGGGEAALLAQMFMHAGYSGSEDEEHSDDAADDDDDDSGVESADEPDEEDMIAAAMVSKASAVS